MTIGKFLDLYDSEETWVVLECYDDNEKDITFSFWLSDKLYYMATSDLFVALLIKKFGGFHIAEDNGKTALYISEAVD